jgi:hypothetical protein
MTVIRLFQQNEPYFNSVQQPHGESINSQYRYALENVEALENALKQPRTNFMNQRAGGIPVAGRALRQ